MRMHDMLTLYAYNYWANERILVAAARVPGRSAGR
jgi:uncharacterized damage-inducible protein DinB